MPRLVAAAAAALMLCACSGNASETALPLRTQSALASHAVTPKYTVYTAGVTPGFPSGAFAWDIVEHSDGSTWFTDPASAAVGRINSGALQEFSAGMRPKAAPLSIVDGPDGNLWFTDSGNGAVGRVTPGGAITEFSNAKLSTASGAGIVAGRDGALWTMENKTSTGFLARVTVDGSISTFALPSDLLPDGSLMVAPDGGLWFTASRKGIVMLVERRPNGTLAEHPTGLNTGAEPCCPPLAPKRITAGPDGNPWFTTLYFASRNIQENSLGTRGPGGFTYYHLRSTALGYPVYPSGIVLDGKYLWVSGQNVFKVEGILFRVAQDGKFEAFGIPYAPIGIAKGRHSIWLTCAFPTQPSQIVDVTFST